MKELEGTGGAPLCRRGACFEHLSFLADGEVGCGEVLRKAASAVRGTVEKLAVASKVSTRQSGLHGILKCLGYVLYAHHLQVLNSMEITQNVELTDSHICHVLVVKSGKWGGK